jgi:tetratricopeptide (TPR) repeat protein
MIKNTKKGNAPDKVEAVEHALSRSEQFIEDHQKKITIAVLVIVAIVGLYLAYQKWYLAPLQEDANSQMFVAEQYFEQDSFKLALNGDLNYPGFLTIIDEYSSTDAGNLAYYYAGISYLKLGQFQEAIDYLSKFDSDDKMLKCEAYGSTGDAYLELNQIEKAAEFYVKAGNYTENEFLGPIYLMRAGQAYEMLKNYQQAIEQYKIIKDKYKNSPEGRVIDKYIAKAEILMKK